MSYNHIIKTCDERVLYFFIKDGLCVKDLLIPHDKYKMIFKEAVSDFYVTDTGNGEVGIICQDESGSIIFLREKNGSYLKTTLLNNRSKLAYEKNFKLFKHNNWISLSYIINYQGNNILSFQIIDNEEEAPIVVDYISGVEYFAFTDISNDIYYFYNKEGIFGYKIYKWGKKDFCEFEKLGDGDLISVLSDKKDTYYIIYENSNKFYLKIFKKQEFEFSEENFEIDFIKNGDFINMIIEKDVLWITVDRNGFTFGKKCDMENFEFSSSYNFANEGNLINYNITLNEKDYIMEKCFGYSVNMRPKLILYKDLLNTNKVLKPKIEIADEEEFNEFLKIEKEKESENKIEITKLGIRLKELEEKIKKIEEKL